MDKPDEGIRYRAPYRKGKIYVIVTGEAISLSMENSDEFLTIAAMSMMEELCNEFLDAGNSLEDLAGLAYTASLRKDDLPRIIHDACQYCIGQGVGMDEVVEGR